MTLNDAFLLRQPWLILPDALHAMADTLRLERPGSSPAPAPLLSVEDGVGVVAVRGPIVRSPDPISRLLFGATSHADISGALSEAVGRNDVRAIFLDIDSPGGTVAGTPELAAQVATVGETKPVYAFSSGMMCSGAYWLASQAQAIYATPSAQVGSIGVILPVIDSSEAASRAGLKVEVFSVGKFKAIGMPGTSLTDEQRDHINANLREVAGEFHAAVLARGRSIPASAMEGQVFSGKQAQRFNLAGLVPDRAEALRRLRVYHVARASAGARVDTGTGAMSSSIEDQLQSALARAGKLESDLAASVALTEEETKKVTALTAEVESLTSQVATLHAAQTQFESDLATARQSVASLTTRNAELEGVDRDFRKSVAIEAARIASQFGTSAPGKVTPQGDTPPAVSGASASELIARYNELVAARQPLEAARFYQEHIAPLLPTR